MRFLSFSAKVAPAGWRRELALCLNRSHQALELCEHLCQNHMPFREVLKGPSCNWWAITGFPLGVGKLSLEGMEEVGFLRPPSAGANLPGPDGAWHHLGVHLWQSLGASPTCSCSWGPGPRHPRQPSAGQPLPSTLNYFYYKLRSQGHALKDPGLNTGNIPTPWPLL